LDFLCDECNDHFDDLKKYLEVMNINYQIDSKIVRGLDYYSKTVFEIINKDITVCGGGRYDYLISEMGGPETPAIGFGLGLERLLLTLEEEGIEIPEPNYMDIFIGSIGDEARLEAFSLTYELRKLGVKCECDHMKKSVKAQMKHSNRINASYSMILGEDEIANKTAKLKRMSDGEIFEVKLDSLEEIKNIIVK
jgi:histidyl-tRNA synthetase